MSRHERALEVATASRAEVAAMLEDHAGRTVREFLARPGADERAELAFWRLIYWDAPRTTHTAALACARELERSDRKVAEVVDCTYVPAALAAPGGAS